MKEPNPKVWKLGADGKYRSKSGDIACPHLRRIFSCAICSPASYQKWRAYAKTNVVCSNSKATSADAGQAGELLVAADLLHRGFPITKPFNINGPHDLHAKIGNQWLGIQVKLSSKNHKTGTLGLAGSARKILSPIIALVFLPTKEIQYRGNPNLPDELKEAPCQSTFIPRHPAVAEYLNAVSGWQREIRSTVANMVFS